MKILKFGAIWCKECLVMRPVWEEIEKLIPDLKTEYFEADENQEVLIKYNVKDIPVFVFLDKNGEELLRLEGMQEKDELIGLVRDNLDK